MRNGPAKTGKVRESGVGRERQHQKDGSHRNVIEHTSAGDCSEQERKDALIAGLPGVGGLNSIDAHEIRDSSEENHQQEDDHGESAAGG